VPGVLDVAFNWTELSSVPKLMSAGVGHVIVGVTFSTLIGTVFVAVVKFAVAVGVNVTDSVCVPALGVVPAIGL